jgi:hypothetical protein
VELPGLFVESQAVGAIYVPPNLINRPNTTLIISYSPGAPSNSNQQVASTVLNITLLDSRNNTITQLDSPLTICLAQSNGTKKGEKECLGYFDENKSKWRCEDKCLSNIRNKGDKAKEREKGNIVCGQTGHLTNFALLFAGAGKGEDPCQSKSKDNVLPWLSLGLIIGAILVVALSALIIEVYYRWKAHRRNKLIGKDPITLPF